MDNLNPSWSEFSVKEADVSFRKPKYNGWRLQSDHPLSLSPLQLCNCDRYRPLKIEVRDWTKNGRHPLIGEVTTSLDDLESMAARHETSDHTEGDDILELINPVKRSKSRKY